VTFWDYANAHPYLATIGAIGVTYIVCLMLEGAVANICRTIRSGKGKGDA
jgi:hypothetical protein